MASVSTNLEMIASASAVSEVISLLVENLEDDQKESLALWTKLIEEYAETIVQGLTPAQLKRRKPEVVAAAAVYDAFLEFESRTNIRMSLPMMHEALRRSQCSINTTWNRLFDIRVSLRGERLDEVYFEKNGLLSDAISSVILTLSKAIDSLTPELKDWLERIETEAIELMQSLSPDIVNMYGHPIAAVTVIYAAMHRHHGKILIRISQRDLSIISATSQAMISRCWIELFEN